MQNRYRVYHLYSGETLAETEAVNALHALDGYSVATGFSTYSDLDPEEISWTFDEEADKATGVYTNYEIGAELLREVDAAGVDLTGGEWRHETLPDGTKIRSLWLPGADDPYLVEWLDDYQGIPEEGLQLGDVVHMEGACAILGDVVEVDIDRDVEDPDDKGLVRIVWRQTETTEQPDDVHLKERRVAGEPRKEAETEVEVETEECDHTDHIVDPEGNCPECGEPVEPAARTLLVHLNIEVSDDDDGADDIIVSGLLRHLGADDPRHIAYGVPWKANEHITISVPLWERIT